MWREDFSFDHPCGLRIERKLAEETVASVAGAVRGETGNGFAWYHLPVAPVEGGVLAMGLCYFDGTLVTMHVRVGDPAVVADGWDGWSETEEKACVRRTEKWLRTLHYRPGNYRWCEIFTGYDANGGSGGGVIRYHE